MKQGFRLKKTLGLLFILFAIILLMLPFAITFNEFLTRIVERSSLYRLIELFFVPYLSLILFNITKHIPGLHVQYIPHGVVINGTDVIVSWNCLGWQSFLLFTSSLFVGLRGSFTTLSKVTACIIGVLGTFLLNIFRLTITTILIGWWKGLLVIVFHSYFATLIGILWLFFFWWFSYTYVLEERS